MKTSAFSNQPKIYIQLFTLSVDMYTFIVETENRTEYSNNPKPIFLHAQNYKYISTQMKNPLVNLTQI